MANYLYTGIGGGGGGGNNFSETIIADLEGIDFSATGASAIYTVPPSFAVIVTKALVFVDDATGLSGTLEAGVGFNANSDNIIPSTTMTGLDGSPQQIYILLNQNLTALATEGDVISFGIDTAFGGSVEGSVVLFGIEVPN